VSIKALSTGITKANRTLQPKAYEKTTLDKIVRTIAGRLKLSVTGTVAAITKDTEQVPILVLRHPDGLMTVYANIDKISVAKGDTVKRGQTIAQIRSGGDGYLHFEVRQGFDSVDPVPYLE
jgi:multidrug efflux pump subunit AcrA (membrane-fusion protein)